MKVNSITYMQRARRIIYRCGIILFLLLLLFPEKGFTQINTTLTFLGAVEQGIKSNQGFAAQQSNLQAKEKDVKITRANFLPSLQFSGSVTPAWNRSVNNLDALDNLFQSGFKPLGSFSAGFNQMIYNEGYFAKHKIQKNLYISQQEQLRGKRYKLITAIGEAYINTLIGEDLLMVLNKNLELTKRNLDAAIYRAEIGAASLQETLRWKTKLYSEQKLIAGQQGNNISNRVLLNQLRGQPTEQIEVLERLTLEKDGFIFANPYMREVLKNDDNKKIIRDFLVELGMPNSPEISSLNAEIDAQNRKVKSAKIWLIPNFSLNASFDDSFLSALGNNGSRQKGSMETWFIGASANWNVFNGGANFSQIKKSKFKQEALEFEKKEVYSKLEKDIRSGASNLIADYLKVNLAREQAEVAMENYQMVYDSYLIGEVALLDLLDAQEQKFRSDYSEIITYYTFLLNLLSVEQAIGYFPFLEPQNEVDVIINNLEEKLLGG